MTPKVIRHAESESFDPGIQIAAAGVVPDRLDEIRRIGFRADASTDCACEGRETIVQRDNGETVDGEVLVW